MKTKTENYQYYMLNETNKRKKKKTQHKIIYYITLRIIYELLKWSWTPQLYYYYNYYIQWTRIYFMKTMEKKRTNKIAEIQFN